MCGIATQELRVNNIDKNELTILPWYPRTPWLSMQIVKKFLLLIPWPLHLYAYLGILLPQTLSISINELHRLFYYRWGVYFLLRLLFDYNAFVFMGL